MWKTFVGWSVVDGIYGVKFYISFTIAIKEVKYENYNERFEARFIAWYISSGADLKLFILGSPYRIQWLVEIMYYS